MNIYGKHRNRKITQRGFRKKRCVLSRPVVEFTMLPYKHPELNIKP